MRKLELDTVWALNFGDAEPVAHLLRDRFNARWVRFHSLPESKRYPDTEEEMRMVLSRHNVVLSRLAHHDDALALLGTGYSDVASPTCSELAIHKAIAEEAPWRSVPMHEIEEDYEDPNYWHVFSASIPWFEGALDVAFRMVAVEAVANVMVLSPRGWLYHPYDGGADVILPSTNERDRLAKEFSAWLSPHPLGL
jgi:hypothetical protein